MLLNRNLHNTLVISCISDKTFLFYFISRCISDKTNGTNIIHVYKTKLYHYFSIFMEQMFLTNGAQMITDFSPDMKQSFLLLMYWATHESAKECLGKCFISKIIIQSPKFIKILPSINYLLPFVVLTYFFVVSFFYCNSIEIEKIEILCSCITYFMRGFLSHW